MSTDDTPTERLPVPPAAYPWAGVNPGYGWPPPYVRPAPARAPRPPFWQTRLGAFVFLVVMIMIVAALYR
jgi:hypothetical protein